MPTVGRSSGGPRRSAAVATVSSQDANGAANYTGAPYLCTGCHWVPGGTHPLSDADETAYTIGAGGQGQTYAGSSGMNCESCHSPHDAETSSGSFILDGAAVGDTDYGSGAGMDVEPTINYTTFCAVCHSTFE